MLRCPVLWGQYVVTFSNDYCIILLAVWLLYYTACCMITVLYCLLYDFSLIFLLWISVWKLRPTVHLQCTCNKTTIFWPLTSVSCAVFRERTDVWSACTELHVPDFAQAVVYTVYSNRTHKVYNGPVKHTVPQLIALRSCYVTAYCEMLTF